MIALNSRGGHYPLAPPLYTPLPSMVKNTRYCFLFNSCNLGISEKITLIKMIFAHIRIRIIVRSERGPDMEPQTALRVQSINMQSAAWNPSGLSHNV